MSLAKVVLKNQQIEHRDKLLISVKFGALMKGKTFDCIPNTILLQPSQFPQNS